MLVLPLRHYNTLAGREVRRAQGFLEPCLSVLLEGGGGGKRLKTSVGQRQPGVMTLGISLAYVGIFP